MSRGLSTDQKNLLDDEVTIHETLIELTDENNAVMTWTTGASDVTVTTNTSGGPKLYRTNNIFQGIDRINEVTWNGENRIGIVLVGDMSERLVPSLIAPLNFRNLVTVIRVYKLFRTVSDNSVSIADPIKLFDGVLVKKTYTVSNIVEKLQLEFIANKKLGRIVSSVITQHGLGAV